jgi:hypothetical protein
MLICLTIQNIYRNLLGDDCLLSIYFILLITHITHYVYISSKQKENNYDIVTGTRYAHGGGVVQVLTLITTYFIM